MRSERETAVCRGASRNGRGRAEGDGSGRYTRTSASAVLLGAASLLLVGCSSGETPGSASSGGAPSDGGTSVGKPGVQDGNETDIDCGGSAARCADGKRCKANTDCASGACAASGTCASPSPTDGVKNGDETDVDCGGSTATKCAAAKGCKVHADCVLGACRDGVCAMGKSCRAKNGGGTCGAGEIGPDAKHEDCCVVLDVPRPAASGGPYKLDKYLVTAGRMRTFIEEVKGDVKSFVNANPPPGWDDEWTKSVPGSEADAILQLGVGQKGATSYGGGSLGPGCFVNGKGAPAYWFSAEQQQASGDIARAFTQDELDTKVLNCATRALFAAFCHWDGGGRLPTYDEWNYAVDGGDGSKKYPWGNDKPIENFAAINFNYFWPRALADGDLDRGAYLPAPGRFPQGKGPFGHMDLAGAVETFTAEGGLMQDSFQEKELAYGNKRTWNPSTRHWAIGARCAR